MSNKYADQSPVSAHGTMDVGTTGARRFATGTEVRRSRAHLTSETVRAFMQRRRTSMGVLSSELLLETPAPARELVLDRECDNLHQHEYASACKPGEEHEFEA